MSTPRHPVAKAPGISLFAKFLRLSLLLVCLYMQICTFATGCLPPAAICLHSYNCALFLVRMSINIIDYRTVDRNLFVLTALLECESTKSCSSGWGRQYAETVQLYLRVPPFSGLLGGVRWFEADVSGLPVGSHFEGSVCSSPETSVSNHLTSRNNPEDGKNAV